MGTSIKDTIDAPSDADVVEAAQHIVDEAADAPEAPEAKHDTSLRRVARGFVNIFQSQMTPHTLLRINFFNFFWVFVIGAFLGIIAEAAFHVVAYGSFESRAGLVWGPFSPLYGVAAVAVTLSMDRLYKAHSLFVFVLSALEGAAIEFFASLLLQYSWGAIAWDYTGTMGSIGGRTNLLFAFIWGLVGLFWVYAIMPGMAKAIGRFDSHHTVAKAITVCMTVFLTVDLTITWMALAREQARVAQVPAQNGIEVFLDNAYPDDFMDARFHNLSVMADAADAQPSEDSFAAQRRQQQAA